MMKKYAIFGGSDYYARGGFRDLVGTVDELGEVDILVARIKREYEQYEKACDNDTEDPDKFASVLLWWHVVDLTTGEIVVMDGEKPYNNGSFSANSYNLQYHEGELVPEQSLSV